VVAVFTLHTTDADACRIAAFVRVPINCPIVVYTHAQEPELQDALKPHVRRDNVEIELPATVTRTQELVRVEHRDVDCDSNVTSVDSRDEAYDVSRYDVSATARVGEEVFLARYTIGEILPEGPCAAVQPAPICVHWPPRCEVERDDKSAGCNANGNSSGAAFALLWVAIAIRRTKTIAK
jgi:hypothetical protein